MGSFQFRSRDRSWNIHLKLDRSNFRQVFSRVNFSIFVAGNLATSETKVWLRRRKRWRLRETVYEERFLPWKKGIENSSKRIKRSFDGVSRIETKFSIGIFSKTFRKVPPNCSNEKSSTLNNFSRNCCSWWHFLAEKKKKKFVHEAKEGKIWRIIRITLSIRFPIRWIFTVSTAKGVAEFQGWPTDAEKKLVIRLCREKKGVGEEVPKEQRGGGRGRKEPLESVVTPSVGVTIKRPRARSKERTRESRVPG